MKAKMKVPTWFLIDQNSFILSFNASKLLNTPQQKLLWTLICPSLSSVVTAAHLNSLASHPLLWYLFIFVCVIYLMFLVQKQQLKQTALKRFPDLS